MTISRLEVGPADAVLAGTVAGDGRVSAGREFRGRRVLIVILSEVVKGARK